MEINNFFLLENFMLDVNGLQIKKGDIITGEVLDMSADTILLNLEDIGEIEGKNGLNTDYLNFGKLKFLVKSYSNGKIELEPILNEKTHETNPEKFENKKITDKIFREYDILEDKISENL